MKLLLVERNTDGSLKDEVLCVACADGLKPSNDRSICVPCRDHPILAPATPGGGAQCECDASAGGICLPANLEIPPERYTPSDRDEIVQFPELGEVRSAFFKEHVKVGAYMCNVSELRRQTQFNLEFNYRVTIQVVSWGLNDIKTKVTLYTTFILMSTKPKKQPEWSPCTNTYSRNNLHL